MDKGKKCKMFAWIFQILLVWLMSAGILGGYGLWMERHYVGGSMFALAWPGLILAQHQIPYAWLWCAGAIFSVPVIVVVSVKNRKTHGAILGGIVFPIIYCLATQLWMRSFACPIPAPTPYDANPLDKAAYQEAYRQGYLIGLTGRWASWLAPKVEDDGYEAGNKNGLVVFDFFLGRKSSPDKPLKPDGNPGSKTVQ